MINGAVEYLKIRNQILEKDIKRAKIANQEWERQYERVNNDNNRLQQQQYDMKRELKNAWDTLNSKDWWL